MTLDSAMTMVIALLMFAGILIVAHLVTRNAPRGSTFVMGLVLYAVGLWMAKGLNLSRMGLLFAGVTQLTGSALAIMGLFKFFIPGYKKKGRGKDPEWPKVRCPYCEAIVEPCVDGSCPECKMDGLQTEKNLNDSFRDLMAESRRPTD